MPITSQTFVRSTALLLLVGLLALLGIVGTNVWLVERSQTYFDEVIEARRAHRAATNLRSLLQDLETSQRGYVITEDESYLEPYNLALPQVDEQAETLREILAPFPAAKEPLDQLQADIDFKLNEMAITVDMVRAGRAEDAVNRIKTDVGKQAMDGIRTFITQLLEAIDVILVDGVGNQRNTINILRWVSIIGGIVILTVVGGAIWAVLNYTRELAQARRAVEEANSGLEERVRERTADLGKANEEIQRFAYIVTHDLRAPLVNIMGFTAELETGVDQVKTYMQAQPDTDADPMAREARLAATEDLPEAVTFIRAATRKMDGLINAILKISREGRRQLKPETVDLAELAEASAAAVHHQVSERGGEVVTDIRVGKLITDKLSLEQILGNMLDNAVKYQDPDRPLRVQIRARHTPGNRVFIEVEDNGRGIADTDHERVFELFRRSGSQTSPGEGIGLAHVRTMVRSLGGDVTLTSKLGHGTTFIINLPRDSRSYLGSMAA
ncbi:sensor domain CHASE3-containing protein [Devosia lucknowensis]|uniref:histidine kinase n=1 Tax=Devosia lucknowensis TaxID=1096929 RepID=A0A1Y6F8U4_9HYPH|nr:CHASE3 domain-containing protein [Devosia lucknowensis]SMQ70021.1 sensor domain CHASE3-containing protein [Devosia lucknowensis]